MVSSPLTATISSSSLGYLLPASDNSQQETNFFSLLGEILEQCYICRRPSTRLLTFFALPQATPFHVSLFKLYRQSGQTAYVGSKSLRKCNLSADHWQTFLMNVRNVSSYMDDTLECLCDLNLSFKYLLAANELCVNGNFPSPMFGSSVLLHSLYNQTTVCITQVDLISRGDTRKTANLLAF